MRTTTITGAIGLACLLLAPSALGAQTVVSLPSSGVTTTLTVSVPEQARITLPASATFTVSNVGTSTTSANLAISIQNIVLATGTKQLRLSLIANAASFTPPVAGATTWSAGDVSWSTPNAGPSSWVNGTRSNGTLSSAIYNTVATCAQDAGSCSTTGLTFTLAAKPTVKRSGAHTLLVRWKVESTGT